MPTLYKPIVGEVESVWSGPAETILVQVLENRTAILERLNFHEEHGRRGDADGRFDKQLEKAENELLKEIAGVLTFAAAQAAEPKAGVAIATLEWIRKHPSAAQDRSLPGFAEWLLADHYQRDDEQKATYFPDIMGFKPNGFDEEMAIPDEAAILKAASAAIDELNEKRSAGRPTSEAVRTVAEGLRSIFLRYNEKITRHSEQTSKHGRLTQTEGGPFFEFVRSAIAPLQNILADHNLRALSLNSIVHNGRYPISSISPRFFPKRSDDYSFDVASATRKDCPMDNKPIITASDFDGPDPSPNDEGMYDDTPKLIDRSLEAPPLLPGESRAEFIGLYNEFFIPLCPESAHEHWLVWHLTVLTWEVMRYRRMKVDYTNNQRRATVSTLIRKAFCSSTMRELRKPGSDIDDNIERYFSDPDYPPLVNKGLEAAGYTANAIEAEMFARALPELMQFEKLIASAEKRLMLFFREMNKIFGDRVARAQEIASQQV